MKSWPWQLIVAMPAPRLIPKRPTDTRGRCRSPMKGNGCMVSRPRAAALLLLCCYPPASLGWFEPSPPPSPPVFWGSQQAYSARIGSVVGPVSDGGDRWCYQAEGTLTTTKEEEFMGTLADAKALCSPAPNRVQCPTSPACNPPFALWLGR